MTRLRQTPGRRAVATAMGVLVGAAALTACDWTQVTTLESEGWDLLSDGGGSVTLEISSRRSFHDSYGYEEQLLTSFMNRGGAIRFQVGEGEADYVQEELGGTPVAEIDGLMYSAGLREGSASEVVPTIEIDVTVPGGEPTTRTYVLDAPSALDWYGERATAATAVGDVTPADWVQIIVESTDPVWWTDGVTEPVALADLPGDAEISSADDEGLHILVEDYIDPNSEAPVESADGWDGYVDSLLLMQAGDGETGPFEDGIGWDFEVPTTTVPVRPSSLRGWTTSGPGVSFVDGPTGSEELPYGLPDQEDDSVRFAGEHPIEYLGTDQYNDTPLGTVGALSMRAFMSGESCATPWLSIGVEYSGPFSTLDEPTTERTVLMGHPCLSLYGGMPMRIQAVEPTEPEGAWLGMDAASFAFIDAAAGELVSIDSFLLAHGDARISPVAFDAEDVPEELGRAITLPGIALHGGTAVQQLFGGGPVLLAEEAPTVPPVFAGAFALGHIGDTSTTTYDFGPDRSGGGGTPGYTIAVPAGGGEGTTTLPRGQGSITTDGNAEGGTFFLVPGGDPAGTPHNFEVLGQSWNITPPAGFDFDSAEVCLPYDEDALTAAGFDEDDLALVHYTDDGLEDITTSIDTDNDIICGETTSFSPFAIGILDVGRLAGTDRAATAAAISAATFEPGVDVAYVATGQTFADALSGGAAAAETGAPVLLVDPTSVPASTQAELERLQPGELVVLGGTAAVSDTVMDELEGLTDGAVTRLAGVDRYATSAAVSAASFGSTGGTVYVATGQAFADALTGGAAAARDGAPVLLVEPDAIPTSVAGELARLDPSQIVVLGGTAAVSDAVADELSAIAPVTRLSGGDRYETAAAIAETFDGPIDTMFVATGTSFPDALTGVPAAGAAGGPIVLVDGAVPASIETVVNDFDPMAMRILGGTAAIADAVVDTLRDAMLN